MRRVCIAGGGFAPTLRSRVSRGGRLRGRRRLYTDAGERGRDRRGDRRDRLHRLRGDARARGARHRRRRDTEPPTPSDDDRDPEGGCRGHLREAARARRPAGRRDGVARRRARPPHGDVVHVALPAGLYRAAARSSRRTGSARSTRSTSATTRGDSARCTDPMRWQFDRSVAGSGVLANLGSHAIDLIHWWFGPVGRVAAIARTVIPVRRMAAGAHRLVSVEDLSTAMLLLCRRDARVAERRLGRPRRLVSASRSRCTGAKRAPGCATRPAGAPSERLEICDEDATTPEPWSCPASRTPGGRTWARRASTVSSPRSWRTDRAVRARELRRRPARAVRSRRRHRSVQRRALGRGRLQRRRDGVKILFMSQPQVLHPIYDEFCAGAPEHYEIVLYESELPARPSSKAWMWSSRSGARSPPRSFATSAREADLLLWQILGTGLDDVDVDGFPPPRYPPREHTGAVQRGRACRARAVPHAALREALPGLAGLDRGAAPLRSVHRGARRAHARADRVWGERERARQARGARSRCGSSPTT